jgi:hypothetical protein
MKGYTVQVHPMGDDACEITLTPSWWSRLWGAQVRRGGAIRVKVEIRYGDGVPIFVSTGGVPMWVWRTTHKHVDDNFKGNSGPITDEISCSSVGAPPIAKLRPGGTGIVEAI